MFSYRRSVPSTTIILMCRSSTTSSELIVRPPVTPEGKFWCSLPIRTLFLCLDVYWLFLETLPLQLVMLFQKCHPHHPLLQSKPSDTWQIKTVLIVVGHLQIQSFVVSRTDFPPHPSQNNQFGKSMVFFPVGVLLLDGVIGVEEAAENRACHYNSGPLLLWLWHLVRKQWKNSTEKFSNDQLCMLLTIFVGSAIKLP